MRAKQFLVIFAWLSGCLFATAENARNIVLIGWDGAQREHIMECLGRGELPALQALSRDGSLRNIDIRGTTDTKAGWSQILSGYDPDVTGVYSNAKFQPVPKGLSVFERLKLHFGATNIATVAVIGKKQHCGEIRPPSKTPILESETTPSKKAMKQGKKNRVDAAAGPIKRTRKNGKAVMASVPGQGGANIGTKLVEESGTTYRIFPGSPYYNMKDGCDEWQYGLMKDEAVGTKAIELLSQYQSKPFFFFVHFAEVDHQGHRFGENSKEYNDALISNDLWTGKIIAKLKELGLYDNTMVYVTADHGFNEGAKNHKSAPHVTLGTNDKGVCRNGDRADITPTILERFGLDLKTFSPALAGHSLLKPETR
jgi:hypothetical protein